MSFEVERKFLVNAPPERILKVSPPLRILLIEQRYLSRTGDWTVRVRKTICEQSLAHHLTMKQRINDLRCVELETEISDLFYATISHQGGVPLLKTRYEIDTHGHLWELDVFSHPKLDGLVLAEIELQNEDTPFDKPEWLGPEVTNDKYYKNNRIAKRLEL